MLISGGGAVRGYVPVTWNLVCQASCGSPCGVRSWMAYREPCAVGERRWAIPLVVMAPPCGWSGTLIVMANGFQANNENSGTVVGNLVQVGRVEGDINVLDSRRSPVVPRQLPAPPGLFVGRDHELAALTDAFDTGVAQGATVVISAIGGVGGVGKTWLALHWAHQNVDRFPDGQLFVNLRGFDPGEEPMSPREAVRGFLDALGVDPQNVPSELDAQVGLYRSLMAGRRILVVLDNARDSAQVSSLLPGTPTSTVVVTSRDRMAGLVMGHSAQPITVDALDDHDAHALLARRLGKQRLENEPAAVADLVWWCAGLPLALSIVAGRAQLDLRVSLAELAAELRDTSTRLGALDVGEPSACLEAVLSWSYHALAPEHARVFVLLGLSPGADISAWAAASLAGVSVPWVREILRSLERVSLVQQHSAGRYRMHDLVRLYAANQARQDRHESELDLAMQRLVDFCTHTAHAADLLIAPHHAPISLGNLPEGCHPQPLADAEQAWAWLDTERANLMATQHLAATKSWYPAVWQLAWALTTFQLRQGYLHDNLIAWKAGANASRHLDDPHTRTRSHRHLGRACGQLDMHDEALRHLQEGLAGAERDGDLLGQAHTHRAMAAAWERQGDDDNALEHSRRALDLYTQLGIKISGSHALNEVGWYNAKLGSYAQAHAHCEEALARCRTEEDRSGEAKTLISLGYIAHHTGQRDRAIECYEQALALLVDLGDVAAQADTLDHLGHAQALRDPEQARVTWHQSLEMYQSQNRTNDARRLQQNLAELNDDPASR